MQLQARSRCRCQIQRRGGFLLGEFSGFPPPGERISAILRGQRRGHVPGFPGTHGVRRRLQLPPRHRRQRAPGHGFQALADSSGRRREEGEREVVRGRRFVQPGEVERSQKTVFSRGSSDQSSVRRQAVVAILQFERKEERQRVRHVELSHARERPEPKTGAGLRRLSLGRLLGRLRAPELRLDVAVGHLREDASQILGDFQSRAYQCPQGEARELSIRILAEYGV